LRSTASTAELLRAFKTLLRQPQLQRALHELESLFYDRLFSPLVTLWCMIFQRLHQDHSLLNALTDVRQGGADVLGSRQRPPLSTRIRSAATTALSKARQRLPLCLFHTSLAAQGQQMSQHLCQWLWRGWRVLLMDGTQVRLRPFPQTAAQFPPSANQCGQAYWVLMRTVVIFCAHTGLTLASALGPTTLSEQALVVPLILKGLASSLYLGDANFGVFWIVHTVVQARAQCLVRLTQSRAAKLLGPTRSLCHPCDQPLLWQPTRADRRSAGPNCQPVSGRLIVASYRRPGFRQKWLYLFTTLLDCQAYPPDQLFELYGLRWQIELDLRYVKTQMDLDQLECKSVDMAQKEWLAGLMAYNLVRALMVTTALQKELPLDQLSFSATRRLLLYWLIDWSADAAHLDSWQALLEQVASAHQPSRRHARPSEPRRKRHIRETFPPLRGSRAAARKQLRKDMLKS
jgi:hypothetical protein